MLYRILLRTRNGVCTGKVQMILMSGLLKCWEIESSNYNSSVILTVTVKFRKRDNGAFVFLGVLLLVHTINDNARASWRFLRTYQLYDSWRSTLLSSSFSLSFCFFPTQSSVRNEPRENLSTRFYSYAFARRRYKPDVDVYQVPSSGFLEFRVDMECTSERFR